MPTRTRWLTVTAASAALAVGSVVATGSGMTSASPGSIHPVVDHVAHTGFAEAIASTTATEPPTNASCRRDFNSNCVLPGQLQTVYGLKSLYAKGKQGQGQTIVVVDAFGSPTIRNDVKHFDKAYQLPTVKLIVNQPVGRVPAYDSSNADRVDWALETTLDVDYAHAMAPKATIRLLETPTDETEGTAGFPKIMQAEQWVIKHHRPDVISQSFGATEQTFPGHESIRKLRYAFNEAKSAKVTVLGASGDDGATDLTSSENSYYPYRVQSWPSADPLVTSVGGLKLSVTSDGQLNAPIRVWNDVSGAGGGGHSTVFSRPSWQSKVKGKVGDRRGVPDISMDASVESGVVIWTTYGGQAKGWTLVGGTSLASPLFSGVIAIADQVAGHRLGDINPALYKIGDSGASARALAGLVDVTHGDNNHHNVVGFKAVKGYDLATGWGTVDAAKFVPALIAASTS